ncbi:MAG: M12 family metallopeptidase [Pseudomonas sp.]
MNEIHLCSVIRLKDQATSYQLALEERPDNAGGSNAGNRKKRAVGHFSKFWSNGRTLKIGFVSDDLPDNHKQAIISAINKWQPFVNLTFEFIDGRDGTPGYGQGDIRIHTDSTHNYTLIGTDAKGNDSWTPTMVLGIKPSNPRFESTIMHEFGHALGAEHEHQHPEANIPWDVPKVYAHYAKSGTSAEDVDEQVLNKLHISQTTYTPYDRQSIMHYPVPNDQTIGDWEIGINSRISAKDQAFMRLAYPK